MHLSMAAMCSYCVGHCIKWMSVHEYYNMHLHTIYIVHTIIYCITKIYLTVSHLLLFIVILYMHIITI